MEIIIHLPSNTECENEFNERANLIYYNAVTKFLKELECTPKQKLQLLECIPYKKD